MDTICSQKLLYMTKEQRLLFTQIDFYYSNVWGIAHLLIFLKVNIKARNIQFNELSRHITRFSSSIAKSFRSTSLLMWTENPWLAKMSQKWIIFFKHVLLRCQTALNVDFSILVIIFASSPSNLCFCAPVRPRNFALSYFRHKDVALSRLRTSDIVRVMKCMHV